MRQIMRNPDVDSFPNGTNFPRPISSTLHAIYCPLYSQTDAKIAVEQVKAIVPRVSPGKKIFVIRGEIFPSDFPQTLEALLKVAQEPERGLDSKLLKKIAAGAGLGEEGEAFLATLHPLEEVCFTRSPVTVGTDNPALRHLVIGLNGIATAHESLWVGNNLLHPVTLYQKLRADHFWNETVLNLANGNSPRALEDYRSYLEAKIFEANGTSMTLKELICNIERGNPNSAIIAICSPGMQHPLRVWLDQDLDTETFPDRGNLGNPASYSHANPEEVRNPARAPALKLDLVKIALAMKVDLESGTAFTAHALVAEFDGLLPQLSERSLDYYFENVAQPHAPGANWNLGERTLQFLRGILEPPVYENIFRLQSVAFGDDLYGH